jgi:hypothetical protein
MDMTNSMTTFTVSKAKAGFSRLTRRVIKTKSPVLVKTPTGMVQIVPYDVPDHVPPAAPDSLQPTDREIELSNTFGETL